MVSMISQYVQELGSVQGGQEDTAKESLKQTAEFLSKYFDIMRDFNQFFSRDGLQVLEGLDARASATKSDMKRVEKLADSLESARKKLAKESAGSAKAADLADAVSCTEKALGETGAEVGTTLDLLEADMCSFGAGFHTAFHASLGRLATLGKGLVDETAEGNQKLLDALGRAVDEGSISAACCSRSGSVVAAIESAEAGSRLTSALGELVDAERKQVARMACLEKYEAKCTAETKEEKASIEPETVEAIFQHADAVAALHREILDEIDCLGPVRKDADAADDNNGAAAAEKDKQNKKKKEKPKEEDVLGYVCKVFESRLGKLEEVYTDFFEHIGLALGTLERAKRKKAFGSLLHKCAQQTVVYGMFPLDQLLQVPGRYPGALKALLQCVLDASTEDDAAWVDFYQLVQAVDELGKRLAHVRADGESLKTLMDVEDKVNGYDGELAAMGRLFYHEENLTCVQFTEDEGEEARERAARGRERSSSVANVGPVARLVEDQTYHVMLFNDMVMVGVKPTGVKQASSFILHENYNFVGTYPVDSMVVVPVQDTADLKCMFKMIVYDKCTVVWAAPSEALKTDWLDKFKYATASWRREQVFGVAPEELMKRAPSYEDGAVPHVLQDPINCVLERGLELEGIFRISGSAKAMAQMRLKLNTGHRVEYTDAFTAAVMIKQWLGALPVPVMQPHLYSDWYAAAALEDRDACVAAMRATVQKMPKMSKFVLYTICDLCRRIVAHTAVNRMTYQNLAIVFVPTLMRVPPNQEMSSTRRVDTLEKVFMLSEHIFPGVADEVHEVEVQNAAYKALVEKRKREALDALRAQHMRDSRPAAAGESVSAAEWMRQRKEALAAQEAREQAEAEAQAAREREEALARQMAEYEARVREEAERRRAQEEAAARREQQSREAEAAAREEYEARERRVREMAARAEQQQREAEAREQQQRAAERQRRAEEAEARRKAAEAEAAAAAAAADEAGDDVCAGCGEEVDDDDDDAFEALDHLWHADCFVCQKCKTKLGDDFKAKNNRPYCAACYGELFCPRCNGCHKPITGPVLKALDATWHKACFVCAKCGKPVTGDFTSTPDGKPLCC